MPTVTNNIIVSAVGASVLNTTDPSSVSWIRVNADNTITYRTAAQTLSDLGAQGSITLTTTGTSGASTLVGNTLNIPQYQAAGTYVTAVTGSGNIASSGGATPNITFTGVLPTANGGTAVNIASAALVLGTASTTAGQLTLSNATNAFTQTIRGTNPAASITYDLPTTAPTLGQVLSATAPAAGVVTLSWATAASGITVGTTTITSGTSRRIGYNLAGVYQESTNDLYFELASPYAHVFAAGRTGVITGVGNSLFGHKSGELLTSGSQNTLVGYLAGSLFTTQSGNTGVGWGALYQNTGGKNTGVGFSTLLSASSTSENTAVGYNSGLVVTTGAYNTFLGSESGNSISSGNYNVGIGRYSLYGKSTTSYSVHIGCQFAPASTSTNNNTTIAIGFNAYTTDANQGVLGSNDSNGHVDNWYFNGVTHTAPYSVVLHACHGSGTNVAAANFTLSGGAATGTAAGGYVKTTTSVKRASGTTLQSDTDRNVIVGKYVDITESAATTYGTLALTTSGTIAGGTIIYTIEANDGTDYQSLTGNAVYSVVNKAGTLTVTFTDLTQALAESAGGSTLTSTMTATVSGTSVLFQANAVSSLVQTTLRISFQVLNNFGVAIISPA